MLYLAANNTHVWRFRACGYPMGWMMSPAGFQRPERAAARMPFALDNGLYHPHDQPPRGPEALAAFYRMLGRTLEAGYEPLFVVCPDVPYDGAATRELSAKHLETIRAAGYTGRVALAVQDGMTDADLEGYNAVFVGGSTAWKWETAAEWCEQARRRGIWSHVARVNTQRRVRHCVDMRADSADGTGIWRGDRKQLAGVLEALSERHLFLPSPGAG